MLTVRGGARFGWANVTMPFAVMQVHAEALSIRAGVLGALSFAPEEVVAVEPFVWVPVVAWGVRVVHTRADAPEVVRFWCLGSPWALRRQVLAAGFVPQADPSTAVAPQGSPFRPWVLPVAVVLWNVVMVLDHALRSGALGRRPGVVTRAMWGTFALVALGLLVSSRVRAALLRPGRTVHSMAPLLRLVVLVLALMAVLPSLLPAR